MTEAAEDGGAAGPVIPASAETLLRFQFQRDDTASEDAQAPVYLLAGHSDRLMRAYRMALSQRGIRQPSEYEIITAIAFSLQNSRGAGLDEETFGKFSKLIEDYVGLPTLKDGEPISFARMAVQGGYKVVLKACSESDDTVRRLVHLREHFLEETMKVACAIALRGWERRPGVVVVHGDEASADTVAQLSETEQIGIGLWWMAQSRLTTEQKKTSDSLPPSPTTETTTRVDGSSLPTSATAPASPRSRTTRRGAAKSTASTPAG